MSTPLTLAEQLALLAYRSDTHKLKARAGSGTGSLDRAMQTALIVELIELGRVRVESGSKASRGNASLLRSVSDVPTGNFALDAAHQAIADPSNAAENLTDWVSSSALAGEVVPDLNRRGIAAEHYKTLGPIRRDYRLEPLDMTVDAEIRGHFDAVFYRDQTASERDRLLAALLADGFLWEFYAPLRGHNEQMRFLSRVNALADSRRAPIQTRKPGEGDDVTLILVALAHTNSSSAT